MQNFKATPLMVGGTLYVNTPASVGAAFDARTGALKWIYNPKSYEAGTTTLTLRWNQRGVAYWRPTATTNAIYWGTGDGYLSPSMRRPAGRSTASACNGKVDLMEGLPRAKRGTRDYLNALTYSVQSPPIVVKDLVITPAAISSLIKTKEQIPGWIRAFDARTGKVRWTFRPIPQKGEFGSDTWQDGSNEYAGKVTVWTIMSADEELGLLYLPTNTTAPDFYGAHRLGNNLFAESVVALDVNTGKRVWHFQTVHHGLWDYDNPGGAEPARHHRERHARQGARADHQAGLRLHVRSRDRQTDLADRREAGAARPMCRARRRRRRSRFRRSRRRSSIKA